MPNTRISTKEYTLKELGALNLSQLRGKNFIASVVDFARIAKELDKVPGLRWRSGCKPSRYGIGGDVSDTGKTYKILILEHGLCRSEYIDETEDTITIKLRMKSYTLAELRKASLEELQCTYFRCSSKRYKRVGKALDKVSGLKWSSGEDPSSYGTEPKVPSGSEVTLNYTINWRQLSRHGLDNTVATDNLTRISIKA